MVFLRKALIFFLGSLFLGRNSVSWCLERCGTLNMIFLTTLPWKHVFFVQKKNLSNKTSTHLINKTKIKQGVTNNLTGLGWFGLASILLPYSSIKTRKFFASVLAQGCEQYTKKTMETSRVLRSSLMWYIKNRLHQAGP